MKNASQKRKVLIIVATVVVALFTTIGWKYVTADSSDKEEILKNVFNVKTVSLSEDSIVWDWIDPDGECKQKYYPTLKELEKEIRLEYLQSIYFDNDNYEVIYQKTPGDSIATLTPKNDNVENKKDNCHKLWEEADYPQLSMTTHSDKDWEPTPNEYLGYALRTPIDTDSGIRMNVLESTSTDNNGNGNYIIVFKHENIIYEVDGINGIDNVKRIANSFHL